MKTFDRTDARHVVQRIIASVSAGYEREALLLLAAECVSEAGAWVGQAQADNRQPVVVQLTAGRCS